MLFLLPNLFSIMSPVTSQSLFCVIIESNFLFQQSTQVGNFLAHGIIRLTEADHEHHENPETAPFHFFQALFLVIVAHMKGQSR